MPYKLLKIMKTLQSNKLFINTTNNKIFLFQ